MDGGMEQPLSPVLRGFSIARVFFEVWNQPGVENCFAIVPGIEPTIEIEIGTVDLQIRQSGHALQGVQSVRQQHGIGLIHRRHRKRSQHKAVIVDDREDLLAPLMLWPE
jgi:hypothetical protein